MPEPINQPIMPPSVLQQLLAIAPAVAHLVLLIFLWQAGIFTINLTSASIAVTLPIFMLLTPATANNSGNKIKGINPKNLYGIMLLSTYTQEALAWYVIFMP
jgi:hypothetical protein